MRFVALGNRSVASGFEITRFGEYENAEDAKEMALSKLKRGWYDYVTVIGYGASDNERSKTNYYPDGTAVNGFRGI